MPKRSRLLGVAFVFFLGSGAAVVALWLRSPTDASSSGTDPVVTIRESGRGVTYTAEFAPRLRMAADFKYTHVFQLPNAGPEPLVVQKKTKSCDCLSAEIDREVIPPGAAANVTLEVKPSDLVYKQAHASILTSADGRTTSSCEPGHIR